MFYLWKEKVPADKNDKQVTTCQTSIMSLIPAIDVRGGGSEKVLIATSPSVAAGEYDEKIVFLSGNLFTNYMSYGTPITDDSVEFSARTEMDYMSDAAFHAMYFNLLKVIDDHSERLFQNHCNIQSIHTGLRRVGTRLLPTVPCIVISVCGKGLVPCGDDILPRELDGYPVDVRESANYPL
jgi:hypothetical protein